MNPKLLAVRGIERHQQSVLCRHIRDAVYNQWTERIAQFISGRVSPGDIELAHIAHIDLFQGRVMRAVRAAQIIPPVLLRLAGKNRHGQRSQQGNSVRAPGELWSHEFLRPATYFCLCIRFQKMKVPFDDEVTMSAVPSPFRSEIAICDPTPDLLWISSGTNSAPPGALAFRAVRYQ